MRREIVIAPSTRQVAPSPDGARPGAAGSGRWLTQELRVKGSTERVVAERPALPPPAARRVRVTPESGAPSDLTRWLATDLRPRGSSPPPDTLPAVGEHPPTKPDSFAPQLGALDAPATGAVDLLDEEDLAVLPGRAASRRRKKSRRGLVALVLLGALAGGLFIAARRTAAPLDGAPAPAAAAPAAAAALPPPPPQPAALDVDDAPPEVDAEGDVAAPVAKGKKGSPARAAREPIIEEGSPGRAGPAVARFADLPLPKLSELAREEAKLAREREEELRRAAKGNRPE